MVDTKPLEHGFAVGASGASLDQYTDTDSSDRRLRQMFLEPSPQVSAENPYAQKAVHRGALGGPMRVLLLDQDPASHFAIRRAVSMQRDIHLIEVPNCREMTIDRAAALRPDALILDVEMRSALMPRKH